MLLPFALPSTANASIRGTAFRDPCTLISGWSVGHEFKTCTVHFLLNSGLSVILVLSLFAGWHGLVLVRVLFWIGQVTCSIFYSGLLSHGVSHDSVPCAFSLSWQSREAASHGGVCGALIRTGVPCSIMPLFSGYICELLRNSSIILWCKLGT